MSDFLTFEVEVNGYVFEFDIDRLSNIGQAMLSVPIPRMLKMMRNVARDGNLNPSNIDKMNSGGKYIIARIVG